MAKLVYGIEGLDRLGKSTLIDGIRQKHGYYEIVHFSKPQKLARHQFPPTNPAAPAHFHQVYEYQRASFRNSMILAKSGARVIFDRWHIGEAVYSPMYRGYDGDYVFEFERIHGLDSIGEIRLILLIENFDIARHFVDDGQSLGTIDKREEEQSRFITAFNKSNIRDKRITPVTDSGTGGFKPKAHILAQAPAW